MIDILRPLLYTWWPPKLINEARSKMKMSYAHTEIRTRAIVIWSPARYQLDHENDKDNNYVFVVLLIHTLNTMQVLINSSSSKKLLVMSTIWPGIFCWGDKESPLFKYKIKHKIAKPVIIHAQRRNTIKLPKTVYNSFSKIWKQLIWYMESIFMS